MKKKIIVPLVVIALMAPGASIANAAYTENTPIQQSIESKRHAVLVGELSGVTGTRIIVSAKGSLKATTSKDYIVDISSAKIYSPELRIGDVIYIEGILNGSTLTALSVVDKTAQENE